jgi:MscS family membrane protein
MDIKKYWNDFNAWVSIDGEWILQVFIVILGALLLNFVVRIVLQRLHKKMLLTANPWDDALTDALTAPVSLLIWILGLSFATEIVYTYTQAVIFSVVDPIRNAGVIITVTWFLLRFARRVEAGIVKRAKEKDESFDITTVDAIAKLVRISIFITSALVILQTLGFSVSGVLAFGGIGGIAIGFAAKDLLANFFGGLMIYMDRPFVVGDWIRSPEKEIEGTVEAIGWRLTCIRTFDKRPLYVPNSTFANIAVENPSRMTNRRINETIGIRYDDAGKMSEIIDAVKSMLKNHPDIDQNQTMIVNFNKFASSSLDFFIYTFTKTTNWIEFHQVKQDVLLKIINIIEDHDAECAFPTSTLHIPEPVTIENDNHDTEDSKQTHQSNADER